MAWKTARVIPMFNKGKRDNIGTIEKLLWRVPEKIMEQLNQDSINKQWLNI